MRLLVFFDLPTTDPKDKRAYTRFRGFLLKDGYDMIQFSVYGRVINGHNDMEKHMRRLNANLPPQGSVRCLPISEKQFVNVKMLVGKPEKQEKTVNAEQLLLL